MPVPVDLEVDGSSLVGDRLAFEPHGRVVSGAAIPGQLVHRGFVGHGKGRLPVTCLVGIKEKFRRLIGGQAFGCFLRVTCFDVSPRDLQPDTPGSLS